MPSLPTALRGVAAAVLIPALALSAASCARKKRIRYTAVAVGREAPAAESDRAQDGDAALLAHLVLSLTPRMDVRWRPSGSLERTVLPLWVPSGISEGSVPVVERARDALRALPRRWRRPSLKRLEAIAPGRLDEGQIEALVSRLRARSLGDPEAAATAAGTAGGAGDLPILVYQMGAARLDAGDVAGSAEILAALGDRPALPEPLPDLVRAVRMAAAGEVDRALGSLEKVISRTPSLAEARWLRAHLSGVGCSAYRAARIEEDLRLALRSSPCCPSCALALAESAAFTGMPERAARLLAQERGCSTGALDAMLERARSLAFAAAAFRREAQEAVSRAEARDASPLLPGLAPAYLILGDHARLEGAYDSEADAHLHPAVSADHHLYSGLNALWTGRPSAAAVQFERATEHMRGLVDGQVASPSRLQLVLALRIRAYLAAGRIEEAARAAREARDEIADLNGFLAYTAALADLASGDGMGALLRTERLTGTEEKYWRYLIRAQFALGRERWREAQTEISLALQGIGTQITVCPGIPTEAYLLEPQARLLLAQGRPREAVRVLDRLLGSGSRGLFAPDVVVPGWLLKGQALEALGDREGAALAYQEVVSRWGGGEEEIPAARRARERLEALSTAPAESGQGPG